MLGQKKRENLRLFRDTLRGAMSCIYMKKSGSEEFLEDVSIHGRMSQNTIIVFI